MGSSDKTPLDFFPWGHIQSIVYEAGPPRSLRDLRNRITRAFAQVRRTSMGRWRQCKVEPQPVFVLEANRSKEDQLSREAR